MVSWTKWVKGIAIGLGSVGTFAGITATIYASKVSEDNYRQMSFTDTAFSELKSELAKTPKGQDLIDRLDAIPATDPNDSSKRPANFDKNVTDVVKDIEKYNPALFRKIYTLGAEKITDKTKKEWTSITEQFIANAYGMKGEKYFKEGKEIVFNPIDKEIVDKKIRADLAPKDDDDQSEWGTYQTYIDNLNTIAEGNGKNKEDPNDAAADATQISTLLLIFYSDDYYYNFSLVNTKIIDVLSSKDKTDPSNDEEKESRLKKLNAALKSIQDYQIAEASQELAMKNQLEIMLNDANGFDTDEYAKMLLFKDAMEEIQTNFIASALKTVKDEIASLSNPNNQQQIYKYNVNFNEF